MSSLRKKWIVIHSFNQFETEEEAIAYAKKRLSEDMEVLTGFKARPRYYVPSEYIIAKAMKVVTFDKVLPPIVVADVD